jgi:hypothetical protein
MTWVTFNDVLAIAIILALIAIIYTRVQGQSIRDTIDDIKEIFSPH